MAVFSLSDVIITITLIVNAITLMASKTYPDNPIENQSTKPGSQDQVTQSQPSSPSIMSRIYSVLNAFRKFSGIIVMWNIFFILLMLFVFRS